MCDRLLTAGHRENASRRFPPIGIAGGADRVVQDHTVALPTLRRQEGTVRTARCGDQLVTCLHVAGRADIRYRRAFEFGCTPQQLWDAMQEVDHFEAWWPWLEEFRLEGGSLKVGSVLHGVVAPPLPYRMRLRVEITRSEPPREIDAVIHGDLEGLASLEIHPRRRRHKGRGRMDGRDDAASDAPRRPLGAPLLQWGHDRVVETTVAGFRRRLESGE